MERRITIGDRQIDQCRHRHTGHCSNDGQAPTTSVRQFSVKNFPFYFKPDDEEKHGHQCVIDEPFDRSFERQSSDTNADGRPDLIVASEIGGTISVFLNEAAPSWPGYAAWAAANGLAQDSMSTDPDHDGRDNREE